MRVGWWMSRDDMNQYQWCMKTGGCKPLYFEDVMQSACHVQSRKTWWGRCSMDIDVHVVMYPWYALCHKDAYIQYANMAFWMGCIARSSMINRVDPSVLFGHRWHLLQILHVARDHGLCVPDMVIHSQKKCGYAVALHKSYVAPSSVKTGLWMAEVPHDYIVGHLIGGDVFFDNGDQIMPSSKDALVRWARAMGLNAVDVYFGEQDVFLGFSWLSKCQGQVMDALRCLLLQ